MTVSTHKRYYFDANALFKYYRDEKGSLQVRQLVSDFKPILVSQLTIIECLSVLMKLTRKKLLKKKNLQIVLENLTRDIYTDNHLFERVAVPEQVFRSAEGILMRHAVTFSFGSNDALHLAIAQKLPCQPVLVTSDGSMKNVCEYENIPFCDPEIETL